MPDIVGTLKPPRLSAAPSSPANGQMYYDTGLNQLLYWNGTTWIAGSGGGGGGLTPAAVSAPYTASVSQLVLMTGANTVTLPAAPAAGAVVAVEALTATATVQRGGTDTINYASNAGLTSTPIAVGTQLNFTYLSGVWYAAQGSAGAVELNATYAARAYRTAALTLGAGGWTKVAMDTKAFDPGNNFSTVNGRYVCPVAGYYHVEGEFLGGAPTGTLIAAGVYKNGALATTGDSIVNASAATQQEGVVVSDVLQCNAGDYLELWGYAGVAMGLYVGVITQNYLSVSLVASTAVQQQPLQVASQARAYRNASGAALTVGAWGKVALDTSAYDAGQNLVLASNRYACPVGGYYQVEGKISANIGAANTNLRVQAGIAVNGTIRAEGQGASNSDSGNNARSLVSDVVQCNPGDYIELWGWGTAAWGINQGPVETYLSVSLVGTQPTAAPANAARAHRNAALTPTAGTWTKIPLDTVDTDPGGNISVANGRYVCPIAGIYSVEGNVSCSMSATPTYSTMGAGIFKNGTQVNQTAYQASIQGYAGANVSDKIQCNAGDYLEVWVYNSQGTALQLASLYNYLSVSLLTAAPAPLPVTVPQVVTAGLPSSPVDGQECYFVADATNGIVWHLKYRAADPSAYKWQFVGGPPLFAEYIGSQSATVGSWNAGAPTVTLPRPGDYLFSLSASMTSSAAGLMAIALGTPSGTDLNAQTALQQSVAGEAAFSRADIPELGLAVGACSMMFYTSVGATAQRRYMSVRPIRLG